MPHVTLAMSSSLREACLNAEKYSPYKRTEGFLLPTLFGEDRRGRSWSTGTQGGLRGRHHRKPARGWWKEAKIQAEPTITFSGEVPGTFPEAGKGWDFSPVVRKIVGQG